MKTKLALISGSKFLIAVLLVALSTLAGSGADFFISEFLAANSGKGTNALRDEDGDSSDWIEIYNPETTPGDIGGWFLTDTTNNLTRWRFPEGAIVPAQGYFIVFASGKNRTNVMGRLHTSFQLNNAGEYLALVNPRTNVVSEFDPAFPPQRTDVSYGRDRIDLNVIGFYPVPTPGSHNAISGLGFGPDVHFSRAGGTFVGSFDLVLSVNDSNSVIRYTLVNTAQSFTSATNIPTSTSALYTAPIPITNTMQVRARAFPANAAYFPGPPKTESYVQLGAGTTNFVSTLPIVVIHTLGATAISGGFPTPDNLIILECFDNDGGTSSLTKPPQLVTRGGLNLRGADTQGYPKSSFSVELWDEFNNDEEKSFLGLPKEGDWILYSPNAFDLSLMHNPIMHQLARDMGHYSSRTRFVEVFFRNGFGPLTANTNATSAAMGDYYGVFVLEEKVKRDVNRVNIDKLQPEHTNYPAITGGYMVKLDRIDPNERTFVGGGQTLIYWEPQSLEMVAPARAVQASYIKAYFDNMNLGLAGNALTNIASTNHYSNYLEVDTTIDYHIATVLAMNVDSYRLRGFVSKPRNGKLVLGPPWDTDRGLGTSRGDMRAFNPRAWQAWDPLGGGDYGTDFFQGTTPPAWLGRWFADVDFWQRWIDRYQHWRASVLDSNRVTSIVDGFGNELREAQVREVKRWGGTGASDTSPRSGLIAAGGGVFSHNFPGTYQGEIDFQKRWLNERIHFIDTNLLNRPTFDVVEGQISSGTIVTLADESGKAGTAIYYMLDGSDPRGFQGTTNPAAILYPGAITITNNVRVRARAVNAGHRNLTGISGAGSHNPAVSTPWSGDISVTYFIAPPRLVITELMYHPAAASNPDQDPDDFEFIELKNVGSETLNLAGFQFTNGIDFTFTATSGITSLAPGDHVLVVKNIAAFTSRYGSRTNIAGQYAGNLANSGERIALIGPRREPILDFVYSDDWYPITDGLGFSLVIRDATAPLNTWGIKSSWRVSSASGGSPGVIDPAAPNLPVVLINEALTHTGLPVVDVIELFNAGTDDANIGGWFLTNDPDEPGKYQFAVGTVIPAGGYAVFDESLFNPGPSGFCIEAAGDELYIFSASGGLLSGYVHGFSFGGAENGVSFGRYLNSQGEEHFVAQAANTLGAANSSPRVGPVVISEIMYHPPPLSAGAAVDNSLDEFIELHNITGTNVTLFDSLRPSNTWKLEGGVSFDFPANVTIAPAGFALLVSFDPANAAQLNPFRGKYNVPPSVPVFGPYSGKLDNSAQSIRLLRPGRPGGDCDDDANTNGIPSYILVDQVDYQNNGPWSPAADGAGASLQRLVLTAYGNDPTNWAAAMPSGGQVLLGGASPIITQHPSSATAFVGGRTNFAAAVSGSGVSVYWRFNGVVIPGATNTTLTLSNVQHAQAGSYDLVALNSGGVVFSSNAQLTVLTPVTFFVHPTSQNVLPGTNVTLTAAAIGAGPIHYQWQHEGTNIPNATNATYSFSDASLASHGNYRLTASDGHSSASSSNAFVFVLVPPGFIVHPLPVTVVEGGTAIFTCTATGAPPLFYRWIRNGVGVLTSTVPVLVLTNVQIGNPNPAAIRCAVTNRATGAAGINSLTVPLLVHADFDGDGVGDPWEAQYGFNTNNIGDGELDFDADGMSNRDEYQAGTNPTNVLSLLKLAVSLTNNQVLQFVAESNHSYTVQYRTNLLSALWTSLSNVSGVMNTVRTIEVIAPVPPPDPERYYRVATPAVP